MGAGRGRSYRRPPLGANRGVRLRSRARGDSGGGPLHCHAPRAKGSEPLCLGAGDRLETASLQQGGAKVEGFAPQTHLPPDGAEVSYQFLDEGIVSMLEALNHAMGALHDIVVPFGRVLFHPASCLYLPFLFFVS